ncbi:YDG domain-containing protein, partial [Algoriphagus sp.]|uniref:YDG domain-containing protein n=1 Tax=Algoriphagus sp. TaxID=1872435 RepID=UPI003919BE7F
MGIKILLNWTRTLFLVMTVGLSMGVSLDVVGQATVETDKDDYAPGMYVVITGSGWQPGETVSFHFDEDPKPDTCVNPHDLVAVADAEGNIFNDEFLVKENHLGVTFTLTATGLTSGRTAVTVFTDAEEKVEPRAGTWQGGQTVKITGKKKSFSGGGGYTVTFGTASSVSANRKDETELNQITTPAHPVGTVDVVISGPSSLTLSDAFTFVCRDPANVIFDETFGPGPEGNKNSSIAAGDYSGYSSGLSGLTFSGSNNTTIRKNENSSSDDYPWATGEGNVYLEKGTGMNSTLSIANINTSGFNDLQLQFGIFKSKKDSNGSLLIVEVSIDNGTTFSPLSFPPLPTGDGTVIWHYRMTSGSIPSSANLRIRFRNTYSDTDFRIDDIRLVAGPKINVQPINKSITYGDNTQFSVTAQGTGLSYQWQEKIGTNPFVDISDGGVFSGTSTPTLTLTKPGVALNGRIYQVIVSDPCGTAVPSSQATLTVNAKNITGNFTADNKIYDGNTSATVLTRTLNGVISPDAVELTGGTATFADKNVANGKTVTLLGATLSGADASNYSLTSVATAIADITQAAVTVSITADDKMYDATVDATVAVSGISGILLTDVVTATASNGEFDNKNVGTGKTVTADIATSGTDAGNYSFNATATDLADITQAAVTVSITADDKMYDATVDATVAVSGISG